MKRSLTLLLLTLVLPCLRAAAQKYTSEKSHISFYSHAAIEDITAENTKVASIYNATTGDIAFSVTIKEFKFPKALMQEHFNEKYMESEKHPKATFQGRISGFDAAAAGEQKVTATGKLTIHGVTKDVAINGTIGKQADKLEMKSKFIVKLADYNIAIPQIMWRKIAEQVEVTVDFLYKPQ